MSIQPLIDECLASLRSLETALQSMDDKVYAETQEAIYDSSIGLHVRHVLDHFERFFAGLPEGLVNYDSRLRERKLETDRGVALSRVRQMLQRLRGMDASDRDLEVIMDLQTDRVCKMRQQSSVGRELAFLHSHATHHYATLAFMFKALQLDIELETFGLAPGTIRHKRGMQCAP